LQRGLPIESEEDVTMLSRFRSSRAWRIAALTALLAPLAVGPVTMA
jgi:hypothetical protein